MSGRREATSKLITSEASHCTCRGTQRELSMEQSSQLSRGLVLAVSPLGFSIESHGWLLALYLPVAAWKKPIWRGVTKATKMRATLVMHCQPVPNQLLSGLITYLFRLWGLTLNPKPQTL